MEILKSTHKHGGSALKRFVLLGSAVSVLDLFEDITRENRPYRKGLESSKSSIIEISFKALADTIQVTAEQAIDRKDNVPGYNISKTQAEQTAREFMKTRKPSFDLTVINPDIITGPLIHPIAGPGLINETNHFAIASFIDGTHKTVEDVRFPFSSISILYNIAS